MDTNYPNFMAWLDIFIDECRRLGYHGPIDRETFEMDYCEDKDPYAVAKDFVDEMNE